MTQINTNAYSLNAQRNLAKNSLGLGSAIERLSSGLRVNSAKDDASGLAVGMTKESASRVTAVDIRTAQDKISAAQIGDGALAVVGDIVTRIIELNAMSTANPATSANYQAELDKLVTTASSIQTQASAAGGVFTTVTVTSAATSSTLTSVATARAVVGAEMNNQEYNIQALRVSYENQQAARSRIMDADFAEETSRLSRFQVLQQAGTAMVAQANAIPQNVLSLLR